MWARATKIFLPENNLGMEASHLHGFVKDFPDVLTFWQKGKRPGVVLTNELKNLYRTTMISTLFHKRLLFERDLFTSTRGLTPQTILAELREQFERFCFKKEPAKTDFDKDRYALSGKMGGQQDDCLISLLMVNKFSMDLVANPRAEIFSSMDPALVQREARIEYCT
jgi:hypothetical protein